MQSNSEIFRISHFRCSEVGNISFIYDLLSSPPTPQKRFSRAALWIGTTSFMILVLPVVFETEKLQMEQQQQMQQRQVRTELQHFLAY